MTGDSSEIDLSSPAHSPSHSVARASNVSTASMTQVTTASDSDWGVDTEEVDGDLYRSQHLLEVPSSTCSSDAVSVDSSMGSCHTPLDDPGLISGEEHLESPNLIAYREKRTLNRSPSLVTLKPFMPEASHSPLLGGSPNFLHHWKQTLSVATVWQTVVTLAKPQHLTHMCSPSRLISILIILL